MSAGHRHQYVHKDEVIAELHRLLDNPKVVEYLQRPHRVDFGHEPPLTGGSSQDGNVYYLHRDLPVALRTFVLWHERVEKALRTVMGMPYGRAHDLATAAERQLVEARGRDWSQYKAQVGKVVRLNEHHPAKMPEDFDTGPYEESGLMHLLKS